MRERTGGEGEGGGETSLGIIAPSEVFLFCYEVPEADISVFVKVVEWKFLKWDQNIMLAL